MRDAFGVERVSKGLPSALKGVPGFARRGTFRASRKAALRVREAKKSGSPNLDRLKAERSYLGALDSRVRAGKFRALDIKLQRDPHKWPASNTRASGSSAKTLSLKSIERAQQTQGKRVLP